eukprot:gene9196-12404_t
MTKISSHFHLIWLIILHSIAVVINHIDDTDETYGYWEPLHYLLSGIGLQTWEYSPVYAIRTYAFIIPMKLIAIIFPLQKIVLFRSLRFVIALFRSYSYYCFFESFKFSDSLLQIIFYVFVVCAPGMFYSASSYLPSSIIATLIMLSYSKWSQRQYYKSIFWASFAVIWSGWPFVALLFIPIGLHMLMNEYTKNYNANNFLVGIHAIFRFCVLGLLTVITFSLPAILIDKMMYNRWTIPAFNIVLYNVLNGNGDELYGIEPSSYYIRNMILNLHIIPIIAFISPIIGILDFITSIINNCDMSQYLYKNSERITVFISTFTWLFIMFMRPHKEERFLYPIYPLLCLLAVWTLSICYFDLWNDSYHIINNNNNDNNNNNPVRVCTGHEWYQFPSHFFLPFHSELHFIQDGFTGILPQHFSKINGTFSIPSQPFNNLNQEEKSRYVDLNSFLAD